MRIDERVLISGAGPVGLVAAANLVAGHEVDRDAVLTGLLDHVASAADDWAGVASAYRRACVTIGRAVRVELSDETFTGTAAETKATVQVKLDIVKNKRIPWLRIDKPGSIVACHG